MAQRELHEGARRPALFRLRLASALAGAALVYYTVNGASGSMGQTGLRLFVGLHGLILALICVVVPGLASGSIARERREGTLGLLFLTPLTAVGIVLAKSAARALQALTIWLALLPVLTIPVLTGGVSGSNALSAVAIEFCVGIICLAGGLAASALGRTEGAAFFLAYTLAGVPLLVAAVILGNFSVLLMGPGIWSSPPTYQDLAALGWNLAARDWSELFLQPTATHIFILMMAQGISISLLFLFFAMAFGAWVIRRSWKDKISHARGGGWTSKFYMRLFARWFGRHSRRALDRNPIAWLQMYSWRARAVKWGLCGGFVLAEAFVLAWYGLNGGPFAYDSAGRGRDTVLFSQTGLAGILAAAITYAAAGGFLSDKKSGALEVLLVTPISITKIIGGRLWGLWNQFLPAAVALFTYNLAIQGLGGFQDLDRGYGGVFGGSWWLENIRPVVLAANVFIALPVVSTYAALRIKNAQVAAILTWLGFFLPWITSEMVMKVINSFVEYEMQSYVSCLVISACNVCYTALVFFLLRRGLARRRHAF